MKEVFEELGNDLSAEEIKAYLERTCERVKEFEPEAFLIVGIKAEGEDVRSVVGSRFSGTEFFNILNALSKMSPEIHDAMGAFLVGVLSKELAEERGGCDPCCPGEEKEERADA